MHVVYTFPAKNLNFYTVYQENQYFVKNMLLLKNPQFFTNEYLIFTKFRNDWVKIVDVLIKAYFWQSIDSPDTQCIHATSGSKKVLVWSKTNIGYQDCSLIKDTKQKYAFIKKSTIFTQSLRNFVKMWYSWVPHFPKIS